MKHISLAMVEGKWDKRDTGSLTGEIDSGPLDHRLRAVTILLDSLSHDLPLLIVSLLVLIPIIIICLNKNFYYINSNS